MAMYTNVNRMTGFSGIDTESMITQMMQAESQKLYSVQKQNTLLTWKQESYRSVASSLRTFQNKFLSISNSASSLRLPSNFNVFSSTVKLAGKDSDAVSVKSSANSKKGSHKLHVFELAEKNTYTSNIDVLQGAIRGSEAIDISKIEAGEAFALELDGVSKKISFTEEELAGITNNQELENALNTKLEEAFGNIVNSDTQKVKANISSNGILSFSTNERGHTLVAHDVYPKTVDKLINDSFTDQDAKKLAGQRLSLKVNIDGKEKTIDFDFTDIDEDRLDAKIAVEVINKKLNLEGVPVTLNSGGKSLNISVNGITNSEIKLSGSLLNGLGSSESELNLEKTSVLADFGGITHLSNNHFQDNEKVGGIFSELFNDIEANSDGIKEYKMKINGIDLIINDGMTIEEMGKELGKAGIDFKYDKMAETFTLSAKNAGSMSKIEIEEGNKFFELYMEETKKGQDSYFEIDGVKTSRTSNSFTLDGVSYTLNKTTSKINDDGTIEGDALEIKIDNDTTKTKQIITDFVEAYNDLIKELNDLYRQSKPKRGNYEPLTDDEKKAMTEKEIEQWEEKAKEGILYRDEILDGIMSDLRTQIYAPVKLSDGTNMYLFDLGITTTNKYREGGVLEIDENKLDEALKEHGNNLAEFFTKSSDISFGKNKQARFESEGIGERINDIIRTAVDSGGSISKKAGIEGQYTEYSNDLLKEINKNNERINDMMAALYKKENHYYQLFAKMESSIMKNDSQMAYLQSMLGL